jgi:hypothetical protein
VSVQRFCRCEHPVRVVDREGIAHCDRCAELLPEASEVALPLLVRHVAALEREIRQLAERIEPADGNGHLLDAAAIAARFGVSRDWVYSRADELGAIRLGEGPKARLRFDPERVAAFRDAESFRPQKPARTPTRHKPRSGAVLLPIHGGPN